MKMKKIISLLLSVCALSSVFATVASAADEKPTMKLVANKISFADEKYSKYAGEYDWSEYNADAAGGSYDTYSLKVVATGVEVKTEAVKSGKSTIYVGDSIVGYQFDIAVSTDGEYDNDWKWGAINKMGVPVGSPSETGATMVVTGTTALDPAQKTAKTINKSDETVLVEFLVTVDSGKPVNFTFDNYALFLATYANTSNDPTSRYEYKGAAGTMVTTTPTYTVPVAENKDPNAVINKVELAEGVMGAAWDVTIENFDAAKSYTATFTAEDAKPEEAKPAIALTSLGTVAETDGDISFAVLLKLTKARAGLALGIEIK